jgi:hypothetical protein
MDPDPDPGGPKTYGSSGSGLATLAPELKFVKDPNLIIVY